MKGAFMLLQNSRQLDTVMEMAALISSTLDARQVRERAIEAAVNLVDAEAGSLILIDQNTRELFFEVTEGKQGEILKLVRLKRGEGIAGWVAEQGTSLILPNAANDSRFCAQMDRITGFTTVSMVCVPVAFKGRVLGVLEAINKNSGPFTDLDERLLITLGNQVAVALENARLFEENISQLTQMVADEKKHQREKEKLLKDLHDGIGGITTNINLMAQLALKSGTSDDMSKALTSITELSSEGGAEIRSFMNGFENRDANWHELTAEFRRCANSTLEPHGISFSMNAIILNDNDKVGMYLYMTLFRIFRETLTNIIKHAVARNVLVQLTVTEDGVTFTICDDGAGIKGDTPHGRGLANMKSRAEEIGGVFSLDSVPGTSITIRVPLPLQFSDEHEIQS
jgi:signal transduction histidine kinase